MDYLVVLFKNKKRKKIIKHFVRKNRAENFFDKTVSDSEKVRFDIKFENSDEVKYELGLLTSVVDNQMTMFKQDELGRNVKIELNDSNLKVIKIANLKLPEKIYDWNKKIRIEFDDFINEYFSNKDLKSVFSINNKLVIQIDDKISLFSLKNSKDSKRLLKCIEDYLFEHGRYDCIFSTDIDNIHRKYLYSLLEKNGINKNKLYRQFTTFSKRK